MKIRFVTLLSLLFSPFLSASQTAGAVDLFAPDHLMQVEIKMAPDDWLALRVSHRVTGADFSQIVEKPYEYYPATAVIDGRDIGEVGVRKKGFVGSAISTRPSLKLKLNYADDDKEYFGQNRLTFNNNNQDPTRAQTVLVYQFMNDAGVNSPRSNLARVVVNGEDLGIYTHVESVRKPFIKRLFGSAKGDLWEGYAGDFTENELNRIVHKWGDDEDGKALRQLYDLLQSPGPLPVARVEELLDLDAFIKLWASEVLIGHWDGYASNRNNFYLFRSEKTGRFYFTPWGPDSAFSDPGPLINVSVPKSFKATGYLCERLWELPEVRSRYRKEMQRLLDDVWDEEKMLAQLQQIRAMSKPYSTVSEAMFASGSETIRAFIGQRRGEVQAELDLPALDWPDTGEKFNPGGGKLMMVSGEFKSLFIQPPEVSAADVDVKSALFSSVPASLLGTGEASLELAIDGKTIRPFTSYGVRTTPGNPYGIRKGYPVIEMIAASDDGHPPWRLVLILDPYQVKNGANQLKVDHFTVWAQLTQGEPGSKNMQFTGFGISGELELDKFSTEPDAVVSGRFKLNMSAFKEAAD